MSAVDVRVCGADPDELEAFVEMTREIAHRQRLVAQRLERALDAAREHRASLGAAAANPLRSLRSLTSSLEAIAGDVAVTAQSFRAADRILATLGSGVHATGSSFRGNGGVRMPDADVSVEWHWPPDWFFEGSWGGDHARLDVETGVGARAGASAGAEVNRRRVAVGGIADARIGAWAAAAVAGAIGPFAATATGEAFLGTRAHAEGAVELGRNGARAGVDVGAFAGGSVSGEVHLDAGPVSGAAHGSLNYGIGAHAHADVEVSLDRIGGRVSLGATLGLGWEGGVDLYVNPREIVDGVVDTLEDEFHIGVEVAETSFEIVDKGFELVDGVAGAATRKFKSWFD